MLANVTICAHQPDASKQASCDADAVAITNLIQIKGDGGKTFATNGDSGSLVLTTGPCPQPVGMVESENKANGTNTAMPIAQVLQTLNFASGNTYTVVPGGSCTSSTIGEVTDTTSGVTTMQDLTVADPDVVQALNALPDFSSYLPICAFGLYGSNVIVLATGLDLSGTVAALDVEVPASNNLDPDHACLPSQYEGVPVVQHVVGTDTGI